MRNGINGYWAEKESETDFTEKLKWIVEDNEKRLEMGRQSREFALEYQWDSINKGLVENYKEAIANYKK